MTPDITSALRTAQVGLLEERAQIDAALAAITVLLGGSGTDATPPDVRAASVRPAGPQRRTRSTVARRTAGGTTSPSSGATEALGTPETFQEGASTRALALKALQAGAGTVRELATRVRLNSDKGYARMHWALRTLCQDGTVVHEGTRYRLAGADGGQDA